MRTLLIPAERHRGARVFWTMLVLAAVVAIASPYMLGLDDTLQLSPRVAQLVPVRPQLDWPPIIPATAPSPSAVPPAPATVPTVEQDVALVASTRAGFSRSGPTAVRGASVPAPSRAAQAAKADKANKAKAAKATRAKAKQVVKAKQAAKPKGEVKAAALAPTPTAKPAPALKPTQTSSLSVSVAQPKHTAAKAKTGHAPKASQHKGAHKPRRHP